MSFVLSLLFLVLSLGNAIVCGSLSDDCSDASECSMDMECNLCADHYVDKRLRVYSDLDCKNYLTSLKGNFGGLGSCINVDGWGIFATSGDTCDRDSTFAAIQ